MGWIARVLSFERVTRREAELTDVKADNGGGAHITAQNAAPPGDDSPPMDGDYAVLVNAPNEGGAAAVGYMDPDNAGEALAGERRFYSRDADKALIASIWLKSTGEITAANTTGTVTLADAGSILLDSGAGSITIGADGEITAANETGSVTLSDDGAILLDSGGGSITIGTDGEIDINGVTISTDGTVNAPVIEAQTSLTAAGLELVGHSHLAGEPPGTTGPNLP